MGPLLSTLADGTAPSGFLASTVVFLAVAAETGAASDQISSGSGVTQTRLDTVAASDTLADTFAASAASAAAETVSASDTASAAGTGRAISADGVAAIETRTAAASTALATTDLVTPSDRAPAPDQSASDQDVQDSAAATDAASSSIIFAVSVTDAAEASDATTNFAAFAALLQETEAAGEAIVVSFSADARHVERSRPLDFRSASALFAADAIASAQPAEAFGHGQALGPGSASLTLIQSRTIALVIEPVRPRA